MNVKERLKAAQEEWRKIDLARAAQKSALRRAGFHTDSGIPIPDLLTPADLADPSDAEVEKYLRDVGFRSEEHTSELQSQSNLVCRLLLEKKKKKNKIE